MALFGILLRKTVFLGRAGASYTLINARQSTGGSLFGLAPTLRRFFGPIEAERSYVEAYIQTPSQDIIGHISLMIPIQNPSQIPKLQHSFSQLLQTKM